MPYYLASHHAVARLLERFPALVQVAGHGFAAAQWLGRAATQAKAIGQQAGMDLMLCLELPLVCGRARLYLPVTPHGHGDTWTIRTVLTEDQAIANQTDCAARWTSLVSDQWRRNKRFHRTSIRRRSKMALIQHQTA